MTMEYLRLGVNIDHVATIRNARGGGHPDPVRAARQAAARVRSKRPWRADRFFLRTRRLRACWYSATAPRTGQKKANHAATEVGTPPTVMGHRTSNGRSKMYVKLSTAGSSETTSPPSSHCPDA